MTKTEQIANLILNRMIEHKQISITSWAAWCEGFSAAREDGIINPNWKDSTVFRALKFAQTKGWITTDWCGVGLTPWAGSARRQRNYTITTAGKKQTLIGKCTSCCMSCNPETKQLCQQIKLEEQNKR